MRAAVGLALILGFGLLGQVPSIDQSLEIKTVSNPVIAPAGRFVAYQVQEPNWKDNIFHTEIWVVMLATGERYQLTKGAKSAMNPKWSPDGKLIAFLSERGEKQQVYVISPTGGEATQLTEFDTGIEDIEWSPDGRHIAFTAPGPDTPERKERKEKYGDFVVVRGDFTMKHLWIIPVALESKEKAKPQQLTSGEKYTVGDFAWSPDSTQVAFTAARDPDAGSSETSDLYIVDVSSRTVRNLVNTPGPETNPVWSPDGKQIAFETAAGQQYFYYMNRRVGIVSAGGGPTAILSEKFDENPSLIGWGSDGIYFSASQRTTAHLFRIDPATKALQRVSKPDRLVATRFSFTKDFSQIAFSGASQGSAEEIFVSTVKGFQPRAVTNMAEQWRPFNPATREVIEWKSPDGTIIEGVLLKPADYEPRKKYPLLVAIHGGPAGVDRPVLAPDRYYPLELFAAKGALILKPNYRGSAGYGERFRSLNVRNLGIGDYQDIVSGVDYLIAKGMVDRTRVGAMGWSQGGYIAAFVGAYGDRFKAVSAGAGISNWTTYYVNTDIHPFTRQYLKATPWDDPEIYRKNSPITYINRARTPTLIQHGENDRRVPIPNAYELFQALQDCGVPSKLIVYKGLGHSIDKPREQRAVMQHNYDWFSEWIWGEKPQAK